MKCDVFQRSKRSQVLVKHWLRIWTRTADQVMKSGRSWNGAEIVEGFPVHAFVTERIGNQKVTFVQDVIGIIECYQTHKIDRRTCNNYLKLDLCGSPLLPVKRY